MPRDGELRSIRQPGPPSTPRAVLVPVGALPIEAELQPGELLLDGLAAILRRHGVQSACLNLSGGALGPFEYVIPALSPDGSQAAFYSATFRPAGPSRIEAAAVTVGLRNGEPFFHCHALWLEADGHRGCGHVLPAGTVVASAIRVYGAGLVGGRFDVTADAETGFSLFVPTALSVEPQPDVPRAVALRLAPNQDLILALEDACRVAGFGRATIQGGVASIIAARFTDAPPIEGFATELLVLEGTIRGTDARAPASEVKVAIVDLSGAIGTGHLVAGDNPVLMTFEGLLQET